MNIEESDPSPRPEGASKADAASAEFRPSSSGPRAPRPPRRSRPEKTEGGGGTAGGDKPETGAGDVPAGASESTASSEGRSEGGRRRSEHGGERSGRSSDRRDDRRGGSGGRSGGGRSESSSSRRGPRSGDRDDRPRSKSASAKAADAPNAADQPEQTPESAGSPLKDLGAKLLPEVSRSFSLTINLLPVELREPITVGYLLARAMDTVADTAQVPAAKRLEHLRALMEMLKYGPDPELLRPLQKDIGAKQDHEGEKELIKELPRCLDWLEAQKPFDRWELRRTLARIGRGQELDVMRFGDATADAPKPLETAVELDEYTYFVAGCVGELWTRLCQEHLPAGWSKLPEAEMLALGKRFGQGLQMVNILRDLPDDLEQGRCYLPAELLAKHGLDAARLRKDGPRAKPLLEELHRLTLDHLDAAWKYVSALGPRKLRYACALPVLIGLETLALLKKNPALETEERVKMSRLSLRKLMASAAVGAVLSGWLDNLHKRLRRRAEA